MMNGSCVPRTILATVLLVAGFCPWLVAAEKPAAVPTGPARLFLKNQPELFDTLVSDNARVEQLTAGVRLGEGPVWVGGEDGHLIFSDAEGSAILRWCKADGLTVFRKPSNRTNGNALDRQGRLISCEMSEPGRRVVRTEADGSITVLADRFNGKKLSSPNDLAIKSDGTIWFTDPTYGILPKMREQECNAVYRLDPKDGRIEAVITDLNMPNGVAFSPDEKTLYVADSWKGRWIWAYTLKDNSKVSNPRKFAQIDSGIADGIKLDIHGNLYSSAPDGVHIFDPSGKRIGKIFVPGGAVNLAFGEAERRTLFITNRGGLYRIQLKAVGVAPKTATNALPPINQLPTTH